MVSPQDSARAVADKVAPAIAGHVGAAQHRIERAVSSQMQFNQAQRGLVLR
jgi:hypothetical protein